MAQSWCAARGRLDRRQGLLTASLVPVGEDVAVVVGHDGLRQPAGAHLPPTDDQWNLDALGRHRLQPGLDFGPLGRAGGVVPHRFIGRQRRLADAVECLETDRHGDPPKTEVKVTSKHVDVTLFLFRPIKHLHLNALTGLDQPHVFRNDRQAVRSCH